MCANCGAALWAGASGASKYVESGHVEMKGKKECAVRMFAFMAPDHISAIGSLGLLKSRYLSEC